MLALPHSPPNRVEEVDLMASLIEGARAMSLELSALQCDQLLAYVALLNKWNKTFNLTAIREPSRMIGLHILDSLAVLPSIDRLGGKTLLDVGSGAGLPGIVLAIMRPQLLVTMLDAVEKKTAFIRQCIGELKLVNALVVNHRVESYQHEAPFDLLISRAFAELADFVNGAAHLLRPGGTFVAMKGVQPHDEIARLPAGYRINAVIPLIVPQVEASRHVVLISRSDKD